MARLANILLAGVDADRLDRISRALEDGGYAVERALGYAAARDAVAREVPDVLVTTLGLDEQDGLALCREVRAGEASANVPVFLVVDSDAVPHSDTVLDAGVDDLIRDPFEVEELVWRIRPLGRLSTMHMELHRRALAARSFAVHVPERITRPEEATGYTVLTVGSDRAEHLRALLGDSTEVRSVDSLLEVEPKLTDREVEADAVVLDVTADNQDPALDLCTEVRNNPRLFNLPVVLVADKDLFPDVALPYRRGASRLLEGEVSEDRLRTALMLLMRRQRLRWHLRGALMTTLTPATRDSHASAYGRPFLDRYLESAVKDAHDWHKALSVVFFYIPNITSLSQQFGDAAAFNLLDQMGQWIGGLVRAEDLVSRFGGNEFCTVLPDTPIEEAEVVMHRIAGVLSFTDFAVPDVYQPVSVWVQVGSALLESGDDVDSLIARARENLS